MEESIIKPEVVDIAPHKNNKFIKIQERNFFFASEVNEASVEYAISNFYIYRHIDTGVYVIMPKNIIERLVVFHDKTDEHIEISEDGKPLFTIHYKYRDEKRSYPSITHALYENMHTKMTEHIILPERIDQPNCTIPKLTE